MLSEAKRKNEECEARRGEPRAELISPVFNRAAAPLVKYIPLDLGFGIDNSIEPQAEAQKNHNIPEHISNPRYQKQIETQIKKFNAHYARQIEHCPYPA